jgi:hypothetical protein
MIAATDMRPQTSTALPTIEEPDLLYAGDLLVVLGPEPDGSVGACFDLGHTFVMTAAEARQLAAAFTRAAAAAESVTV